MNAHQNICSKRFGEADSGSQSSTLPDKTQMDSINQNASEEQCYENYFLGALEYPASSPDSEQSFFIEAVSSKSSLSVNGSSSAQFSHIYTSSSNTSSQKRPGAAASVSFVPALKTRSQRRLGQIMEKHNSRRLMLEECSQMREVPHSGAWWTRNKKRKRSLASHHPNRYLSQDAFVSALGLARTADVAAMAKKTGNEQEVDLDCEIISVEGPLSAVPPPPPPPAVEKTTASPRATRSLMSQLSRDSEVCTRRRLSFCFVEDEWADREALNEGRDPLQISLLTLDLSSPLGQRVKKYVRGEGHLNIVKDIESYCRTGLDEDGYSKLRFRGCDFRVTYRKKRRASHYVHTYKFNKSDRLEFKTLLKTGLSAHSRHIQKALPVCKVVLNRLSDSEIKLWTEEKKITIAEQIVYDDDICITHIDIPESKLTQGFSSDTHSPSQQRLHRKTQYPVQSSPMSVGRQCIASDSRLLLSPRTSASPPHVPNIFRNRTSFTSSPPHPSSVSRPGSFTSGWRPQHVPQKAKRSIGGPERPRFHTPPPSGNRSGHQRIPNKTGQTFNTSSQNLNHLSAHKCLTPSTYGVPVMSEAESRSSGEILSASRRKQQLNDLRMDDGDGGYHSAASVNRNVTPFPVNHDSSHSSRNKRLVENNHGNHMQKQNELCSPGLPLQPSTRKLSNFDYFSIRDGRIQPSYPHNGHAVVSQRQPCAPLAPAMNPHNRQNASPHRHTSQYSRPNHHPQPPSPLSHSQHPLPHHNSTSQQAPGPTRPSSMHNNNFPQQRLPSGYKRPEGLTVSGYHNGANNVKPPQPKTVAQLLHKRNYIVDDDVMEVICIDDD